MEPVEEAEEVPEVPSLRNNFVFSGEVLGEPIIDFDYKVGVITIPDSTVSVSCISVCAAEDHVLVCVPDEAWHRLKKNRIMPPTALKSAVRVCVRRCEDLDRTQAAAGEASLHVWLGLLDPNLEQIGRAHV